MGFKINDPAFFHELKQNVVNTFQKLGYIKLPIDPSELMEAHGIQSLAYQVAYDSNSVNSLPKLCKFPSGISFIITEKEHAARFIACNLQELPGRVRFTKLHELGHVIRGHLQDSETAEIEANFFARYAIAPPVLVEKLGLTTVEEIAQQFGTSIECASHVSTQHTNWLRHRQDDKAIDDSILELYMRGLLLEGREKEKETNDLNRVSQ